MFEDGTYFQHTIFPAFQEHARKSGMPGWHSRHAANQLLEMLNKFPEKTIVDIYDRVTFWAGYRYSTGIWKWYKEYARNKGVFWDGIKASTYPLYDALQAADPNEKVEDVFDRVIHDFMPDKGLYAAVTKKMGWASAEEIGAENRFKAKAICPGPEFFDWLHSAFERYEVDYAQAEKTGKLEDFYDKFTSGTDVIADPQKTAMFGEAQIVASPDVDLKYLEHTHEPTQTRDTRYHLNSSFTNRLKCVDWKYYLHQS